MLKILVVDDDAELNRTVCKYLEMNGYGDRCSNSHTCKVHL